MHGDGSLASGDDANAEDIGLLSNHGEDFEVEHETKPFLSAFFQSSIPDDIVNDFRYVSPLPGSPYMTTSVADRLVFIDVEN